MGSLSSPPPPSTPQPPSETSTSSYRIFASFCYKEPFPNINISNWIVSYNPLNNTWTHVTTIPGLEENLVLKDFAMISVGDSIFIIGGRLCHKERAHITDELADIVDMNIEVLSSVWRYDLRSNKWSRCAPLNVPRYDFAFAVCENKIYVAGGQSTLDSARGISFAEVYDTSADEWTSLANMSTLRYKCVAVTWQGKIYVVGGFADRGDSENVMPYIERSSAEVYNIQTGKWDLVAGMWQLDVPPNQIVPVNGSLFSSGDCLNAWKGHIEAYDGKLKIWYMVDGSQQQNLSSPISTSHGYQENWSPLQRVYLTMATIGTHLYFLAGYRRVGESSRTITRVHMFDTSATRDPWTSYDAVEEEGERELCGHCCVVQLA